MGCSELSLLTPAQCAMYFLSTECVVFSLVGDVDDPLPLRGGQQGLVVLQPGLQLSPQGGGHGDGGTLHLQQTCTRCCDICPLRYSQLGRWFQDIFLSGKGSFSRSLL